MFIAPAEADLAIGLDAGPGPVVTRGDVTYVATAGNGGPDPADGATVAVLLPEGTSFAGRTTDTGTCAPPAADRPRVVVCDVGTLPAGGGAAGFPTR